jgi:hypothetical protein
MELVLAEGAVAGKLKKKLLDQVRDALNHLLRPLPSVRAAKASRPGGCRPDRW